MDRGTIRLDVVLNSVFWRGGVEADRGKFGEVFEYAEKRVGDLVDL